MNPLEGIDVSAYQGIVSWIDAKRANKSFAAIKATEGTYYHDSQFPRNWQRSHWRGLMRGAYHFLRPSENGTQQADLLTTYVRAHGDFQNGDFVMLDCEVTDDQSPDRVIAAAEQFVDRILLTTICGVFLYTYPDLWIHQLGDPSSPTLARCPLWLADYGPSVPALKNWPAGLSIWQYSSTGHVPGVEGSCDLDRAYMDPHTFRELAQWGGRR